MNIGRVFRTECLAIVPAPTADTRDALLCTQLIVLFYSSHSVFLAATFHISTHPRMDVVCRGLYYYRGIVVAKVEIFICHFKSWLINVRWIVEDHYSS